MALSSSSEDCEAAATLQQTVHSIPSRTAKRRKVEGPLEDSCGDEDEELDGSRLFEAEMIEQRERSRRDREEAQRIKEEEIRPEDVDIYSFRNAMTSKPVITLVSSSDAESFSDDENSESNNVVAIDLNSDDDDAGVLGPKNNSTDPFLKAIDLTLTDELGLQNVISTNNDNRGLRPMLSQIASDLEFLEQIQEERSKEICSEEQSDEFEATHALRPLHPITIAVRVLLGRRSKVVVVDSDSCLISSICSKLGILGINNVRVFHAKKALEPGTTPAQLRLNGCPQVVVTELADGNPVDDTKRKTLEIVYLGKKLPVRVGTDELIKDISTRLCRAWDVSHVELKQDDIILDPFFQAADLELGKPVFAALAEPPAVELEQSSKPSLTLKISWGNNDETVIKMFEDQMFGEICEKLAISRGAKSVILKYDGETLDSNATPAAEGLEDDDQVEAFLV